ncbi:ankyrin repeat protein [Hokovirus HKV1]|uniref:Ankyrin repeat protein n=1 Tax=Hokovirus HKV1 TaxID=1977638 RepID=A0A1V0SHB9_9VIRU|nr:ankyrin repeat protein [Hokovirus HKV1]
MSKFFEFIQNNKLQELIINIKNHNPQDINININDKNGNYLLNYAIINNNIELVKLLLEYGAYLDILDADGKTILYLPIKYNYYNLIKLLLDYDEKNVGISILEMKDRDGFIPLYYAVHFKNYDVVKLLIVKGSNINILMPNNYNILHIAIVNKSYEICELILQYIKNINAKTNEGYNALHLAIINNVSKLIPNLIKMGINLNAQDIEYHFTPLIYTVINNNASIFELLVINNCNLDMQDIFGNTILHYLIADDNFELFNILYDKYENKISNDINFNIYNYESNLPLHIALENNNKKFIKYLIDGTNLNFQNNNHESCFHLIVKNKLWKNYYDLLTKKKLNVFLSNKKGEIPFDYVLEEEIQDFLLMVAKSYLYVLVNYKQKCCNWKEAWENLCSAKPIEKSEKEIIRELLKYIKNEKLNNDITEINIDSLCLNIIKNTILKYYDEYKKTKSILKSYPTKKEEPFKVETCNYQVSFCTYTGTTLDVLIGLIYILKKYNETISTVDDNFMENRKLCDYYKSIGIEPNTRCEFLNFEMIWINNNLHLAQNFVKNFKEALDNKNKRFIIVPLGIELSNGSHSNFMIYDKKINEIERFEPHGSSHPVSFDYNPTILDDIITKTFKNINKNIKYISPSEFEPKIGFQYLESVEKCNKNIGDPGGFCAVWALWYVEQRIKFADLDRKLLIKKFIKYIKIQGESFRNIIRNYSYNITELRDKYFKEINLTINQWLNDQYNDETMNKLIKKLGSEIINVQK